MTRSFSPHVRSETVRVSGAQPVTVVLTPRDKAILGDLVKHRALSSPWLARAAQLFHTMAVADVAALLLERLGGGSGGAAAPAAWRSERELRGGGGAGWLPRGCYPD